MKTIKLTVEQAKSLYEKDNELRTTILHQFTNEELGINNFPESWEGLGRISGHYIMNDSLIIYPSEMGTYRIHRNLNTSYGDCLKQLAECQLRQLAKFCNDGEIEEDWVDWNDNSQKKYFVFAYNGGTLSVGSDSDTIPGIPLFKRHIDAEKSMIHHEDLWLKFYKL